MIDQVKKEKWKEEKRNEESEENAKKEEKGLKKEKRKEKHVTLNYLVCEALVACCYGL